MKIKRLIRQGALAGILLAFAAGASDELPPERHNAIAPRNAFGLRNSPQTPEQAIATPPQDVTVKLTGITAILSNKRVLLQITERGKTPQTVVLKEGDREGSIQVKHIDARAGVVKIINGDKEMELNFEKDGIKPPTAPAPGSAALASTAPSGDSPAGTTTTGPAPGTVIPVAPGNYSGYSSPSGVIAPASTSASVPAGVVAGGASAASPVSSVGFRFGGPATLNYQNPQPGQTQATGRRVSAEEIALQHEISTAAIEEYARRKGIPPPPRLPTPWSSELYGENSQTPNPPTPPSPQAPR